MNHRDVVNKRYQAELQGESAQHDEARLDHCGMVNTVAVQRKIVFLPGDIYLPMLCNNSVGTYAARRSVNRVEVSQRREPESMLSGKGLWAV